ncbi:MAG: hypothetical protein WAW85_05775 [Gordonia sp. (in: high G+C Gram-positive bacteria)]|uniref:hypothetical protein n=1 Tax=Gordonia sp. (in: high G+C Gram-positive bacteria) TaxID=84139 RepID=UPI003BB66D5C
MGDTFSPSGAPSVRRLRSAVTGHRGTGRDTVAAALTDWFGIAAARSDHSSDADLVVHVLGAGVRDCDRRFLTHLAVPVVVVAGKADLRGPDQAHWRQASAELAARASGELALPVHPVSGLLARATISEELLADLDRWLRADIAVPPIAAAFADVAEKAERRRRATALVSLGTAGLRCALAVRAEHPSLAAGALTRALRASSGFGALVEPIRAHGPAIAEVRAGRRRRNLAVRAAGCLTDRDELERGALAGVPEWGSR